MTRSPDEIRRPHGIPATSPARTLLDLADSNLTHRRYRRLVNEAQVQRLVTEEELRRAVDRARGRSTWRLKDLIADGPTPTRSTLEDDFAAFARRHQLPDPIFNALIHGVEVDVHLPALGLVVELDGERFHETRIARRADAAKQALLEANGLRVVRISPAQLADAPQTLRRLRPSASASPRRAAA
jgi:very-short-patch-repair endonuclease